MGSAKTHTTQRLKSREHEFAVRNDLELKAAPDTARCFRGSWRRRNTKLGVSLMTFPENSMTDRKPG